MYQTSLQGSSCEKSACPFLYLMTRRDIPALERCSSTLKPGRFLVFFAVLATGSLMPIMSRLVSKVNDPRVGNDSRVLTTWPTSEFHNVIAPRNPATKNRSRYDLRLRQSHGVDYDCAPGYFANMHFASAISCCCLPCSRSVEREALA